MDADVRWSSLNKLASLAVVVLVLGACAGSAPELPEDYSSVDTDTPSSLDSFGEDAALSCDTINDQIAEIDVLMKELNAAIVADRDADQSVFLGSIFFLPVLLAADSHDDEKATLNGLQARRDQLIALRGAKDC